MLRQKLIDAAARVYGEYGFRGATTRRIAEEAGVNEVTLFRHFGSKDALIAEVVRCCARIDNERILPEVPVDPELEITQWAIAHLDHLRASRSLIRKTMGEIEERPEVACVVGEGSRDRAGHLKAYMGRLADHGFVPRPRSTKGERDEEAHAAGTMLMSALFADAMGREVMPEMYPQPAEGAAAVYVRVFLRAISCDARPASRRKRGGARAVTRGTKPGARRNVVPTPSPTRAAPRPRSGAATRSSTSTRS